MSLLSQSKLAWSTPTKSCPLGSVDETLDAAPEHTGRAPESLVEGRGWGVQPACAYRRAQCEIERGRSPSQRPREIGSWVRSRRDEMGEEALA